MPGIDGLVTGLDTTSLINGLLAIQQQRVTTLQAKESTIVQKQTAFKGIEARLLSLQSSIANLASVQNGAFDGRKVDSSDTSLVTAAASSNATPGVYSLRVKSLARSQQIASQGFDDPTSKIFRGTIQIKAGSSGSKTITIDSSNDTLQGLTDAINTSGAGVTATIINDGSDSRTQPYRLVLTSNTSGVANAISLTNNLTVDGGGAVKPVLDATFIGVANTGADYTGSSTPTSNSGADIYSGTDNKTYTFTVVNGGTLGTNGDDITLSYTDNTGTDTGNITLSSGDADVFKSVGQHGVQVKFSAGTLVARQSFSIDAFAPKVQAAANASITLGSGDGALSVETATNQVDNVIPGVTLNLVGANTGKDVSVTVSSNTDAAGSAIQGFVDAYNGLLQFVDDQVQYNATNQQAGPLLGDASAFTIEENVRRVVENVVPNVNSLANHLSAIGITTNSQGQLQIDQNKLSDALAGNLPGVTLDDVRRLFTFTGTSTNSGVQFLGGSARTKASTAPYQVDVTQAARQASITATTGLDALTTIDDGHDTLTITVDGKTSSTIALGHGNYTPLDLAKELQAQINANTDLKGEKVNVGLNGAQLVISSVAYGSSSEVTVGTSDTLTRLGFSEAKGDHGLDVQGKFIVNGVEETATGLGQLLIGSPSNANTADLRVKVTLTAAQVQTNGDANLTVTRGIASQLDAVLNGLLDPFTGRTKVIDDSLQSSVDDIESSIKFQNNSIDQQRTALQEKFATMEAIVSQLRASGDFLSGQLNSFQSLNLANSKKSTGTTTQ